MDLVFQLSAAQLQKRRSSLCKGEERQTRLSRPLVHWDAAWCSQL